jgi:acetyltransferase-like isoleucine patch superfamily enzyme
MLDGRVGITIGTNVSISVQSCILSLSHDPRSVDFSASGKKTCIEDYVWCGARSLILPGITIGRGAVVGAGAVVTADIEPYTIVGGNPARPLGHRPRDLSYTLDYRPLFNTDII